MKKLLVLLLIFALIFTFTACAEDGEEEPDAQEDATDGNDDGDVSDNDDEDGNVGDDDDDEAIDNEEKVGQYEDGTYSALGDKWDYGQESSTVIIEKGQIVAVELKRLTTEGDEVDYDNWTGEERNGKVYPNLKDFRQIMAEQMVEQQTYDVDTIAGATVSTTNWRIATKRALEEAAK